MDRFRDWRETRRLTSRRAGVVSRRFASEDIDRYVRSRGTAIALAVLAVLALGGIQWFVLAGRPEVRGLSIGLTVGVGLTLFYHWIVLASGAFAGVMGEAAEQWTDAELRRLRRKGWRHVSHLEIDRKGDIDHVAVGPDGVVVIETKWTSGDLDVDSPPEWLRGAIRQAKRNRDQVRYHLGWKEREGRPIVALVVLWGPRVKHSSKAAVLLDGVNVISGEHLREELNALSDLRLAPAEVKEVHRRLAERIVMLDEWDAANKEPLPETLQARANRWARNAGIALVGLAAGLSSLALELWGLVVIAALALGASALRRVERAREPAGSFLSGLLATVPVCALVLVWLLASSG